VEVRGKESFAKQFVPAHIFEYCTTDESGEFVTCDTVTFYINGGH